LTQSELDLKEKYDKYEPLRVDYETKKAISDQAIKDYDDTVINSRETESLVAEK